MNRAALKLGRVLGEQLECVTIEFRSSGYRDPRPSRDEWLNFVRDLLSPLSKVRDLTFYGRCDPHEVFFNPSSYSPLIGEQQFIDAVNLSRSLKALRFKKLYDAKYELLPAKLERVWAELERVCADKQISLRLE